MAVLRRLGQNIPAAGGGYFRLLPYGVTRGPRVPLLRGEGHGWRPIQAVARRVQ
jgi:hypothetical protein